MKSRSAAAARMGLAMFIGSLVSPVAGQVIKPVQPVAFEPNRGQADKEFEFVAKGLGYAVGLTGTGARITLASTPMTSLNTVSLNLVGARHGNAGQPADKLKSVSSYLLGHTSISGLPTFAKVRYAKVWPGVDVLYYGTGQQLESDFVVAPHADPKAIRMRFDGAQSMRKSPEGDLILKSGTAEVIEAKPAAYQLKGSERMRVSAAYRIGAKGIVTIEIGDYDHSKELVIDPITRYLYNESNFNPFYGAVSAASVANSGPNSLVVGWTPPAAACQTCTPHVTAFISEFDATGDLIYTQDIAAADGDIYGLGAAADAIGNVYVTGYTSSAIGFPLTNAFQAASGGGQDAFLIKVTPNLQQELYGTYLGGSGNDQGSTIAVNGSIAYVVGVAGSTNFPVASPPAGQNGFVYALDTSKSGGASKVYGIAVGGSGTDAALAVASDSSSNVYVGGTTTSLSSSFVPTIGASSYLSTKTTNNNDGFLIKLNSSGTLTWGTFFPGGPVNAVAISGSQAVIAGETTGSIMTTSTGYQISNQGSNDAFVAKLDTAQSGTGALLYSTYLGGAGVDAATGVAIGSDKNIYVAGTTSSSNFPTAGTPRPVQATYVGGSLGEDGFFTILNPSLTGTSGLLYSTFVGNAGNVQATGIALDGYNQAAVSATNYTSGGPASGVLFKFGTTFGPAPASVTDDINGDGYQDVVVYNPASGGYEYSLLSQANGTYTGVGTFMGDINPGSVTFDTVLQADFNGDLKSDVLFYSTATGTLKIGLANLTSGANTPGTGRYTYTTTTISPGFNVIARGDFNNDGKTDLLLYRQSDGAAAVALSNGDGTFTYVGQAFSPGFTSVVVGDFNGDGISDVVVYNNATSPYVAYLLFGDGAGHFVNGIGLFFGGGFTLFPGDLNVDGKTDLVLYRPTDGTTFIALSNGTGFNYQYQLYSPNFTSFKIGDVNGDGNPDFVLYNANNGIGYLLLGDGAGNFPSNNSLFFGPGMDYVELRDVNGDGKQDVILFRTADGTSFTGISNLSAYAFSYTYNYFGPGRIVAK